MCRRAVETDRSALMQLWQTAFPEDIETDVQLFMQSFSPTRYAYVLCENETVCSMLFLLPATLEYEKKRLPVGYIYAGATLPSARGKGYYKHLIAYVEETAKADGIAVLMLYPATPSLSDSYHRMGFTRSLCVTQRDLTDEDLLNSTEVSPTAFASHRREWMRENGHAFVDWNDGTYEYAANWCEAIITASGQWLWISRDSKQVFECIPWQPSDVTVLPLVESLDPTIEYTRSIWFGYGLQ